jgi:tryptophan-rich sensory protein
MSKLTILNLIFLLIGLCFVIYAYKEEVYEFLAVLKFLTFTAAIALLWLIMLGSRECYVVYEKDIDNETQIRKITFPAIWKGM